MTARSESGSVPTISAAKTLPSFVFTSTAASATCPPRVTTWVFVRMCPSSSRMIPEPEPPDPLPLTAMVTTLGEALTAAAVISVTLSSLLTMMDSPRPPPELEAGVLPPPSKSPSAAAAIPPPSSPAARTPARKAGTPMRFLSLPRGGVGGPKGCPCGAP